MTQESSNSEQFLLKNAREIQKTVINTSNEFKSPKNLVDDLSVLYIQKELLFKEYFNVVLFYVKDFRKSSKSIRIVYDLIKDYV